MRQYGANAAESGVDIQVQYAIPDVRVAFSNRPADVGACIGVKNIQAAGEADNVAQHRVDLLGFEQIDLQGKRVLAQLGDKALKLLAFTVD